MAPTLTPVHCKAARALLAWNQQELAQRAQLGVSTIADFERGKRTPTDSNIEAMINAFVAAGISFVDGGIQIAAATNAHDTSANTSMPRLIEATDLDQWAQRNDGKQYFPELYGEFDVDSFMLRQPFQSCRQPFELFRHSFQLCHQLPGWGSW